MNLLASKKYSLGRLYALFAVTAAAILLPSCAKEPSVEDVAEIRFLEQRGDSLTVEMDVIVDNPNGFNATVKSVESQIYVKGKPIGHGRSLVPFTLPKKQQSTVPLLAHIDLPVFSELYPQLLAEVETKFLIENDYRVKLLGKTVRMRRSAEVKLNVRQLVEDRIGSAIDDTGMDIVNVTIRRNAKGSRILSCDMAIENPFSFAFKLQDVKGDVYLEGNRQPVGELLMTRAQAFPPGQTNTVNFETEISSSNLFMGALGALFGSDQRVTVKGIMHVAIGEHSFSVPFTRSIPLKDLTGGR